MLLILANLSYKQYMSFCQHIHGSIYRQVIYLWTHFVFCFHMEQCWHFKLTEAATMLFYTDTTGDLNFSTRIFPGKLVQPKARHFLTNNLFVMLAHLKYKHNYTFCIIFFYSVPHHHKHFRKHFCDYDLQCPHGDMVNCGLGQCPVQQ